MKMKPALRYPASVDAAAANLPATLRAPLGLALVELSGGRPVTLRWPEGAPTAVNGGWLRVTTGIDDREQKRVEVRLAGSGRVIGEYDLRFAHAQEAFQVRLDASVWAEAVREGVTLTLLEPVKRPLWLLGGDDGMPEALAPHLLPEDTSTDRTQGFFGLLGSVASAQPFGWMEGCVLDGLNDLAEATESSRWREARDAHLGLFFKTDGTLIYEDPGSRPADNEIRCIEETLPFAVLAKRDPNHPLLQLATDYWAKLTREGDSVEADDRLVSTEGSYTIAYPMAVIARQRRDRKLAELAANQLRIRRYLLRREDGLWLRYWRKTDERHIRSWARGVAWYLQGLERSLRELRGLVEITDLEDEFRAAATWAAGLQRADGLWGCFLDDPACKADTSGSAGIAAALARGARVGVLTENFTEHAKRAWGGLQAQLCVDGMLDGGAQSNRGGEALQRGDYRVLTLLGVGLMGQLAAALGDVQVANTQTADTAVRPPVL
jgi:unsaturated rhamnogalacturonyl hydrolase